MKEEKRGGARSNCGRKKVQDPKKVVSIWIETSIINKWGGLENCKEICKDTLLER